MLPAVLADKEGARGQALHKAALGARREEQVLPEPTEDAWPVDTLTSVQ